MATNMNQYVSAVSLIVISKRLGNLKLYKTLQNENISNAIQVFSDGIDPKIFESITFH